MIESWIKKLVVIVHLKMADIDTYEFDFIVYGYHQY